MHTKNEMSVVCRKKGKKSSHGCEKCVMCAAKKERQRILCSRSYGAQMHTLNLGQRSSILRCPAILRSHSPTSYFLVQPFFVLPLYTVSHASACMCLQAAALLHPRSCSRVTGHPGSRLFAATGESLFHSHIERHFSQRKKLYSSYLFTN
jgi:hypothetical protein